MKKVTTNAATINHEVIDKILEDQTTSKSAKIKALFDLGLECKDIATSLGIRYNFAYNIISNYARINGIEIQSTQRGAKTAIIRQMALDGKTIAEISKETKTNYSQVWKIYHDTVPSGKAVAPAAEHTATKSGSSKVKATQSAGEVKISHIAPNPATKEEKAKAVATNATKG